jgi:hypothetical protein
MSLNPIPGCVVVPTNPPLFRFYIIFHKFLTKVAYEKLTRHYLDTYCRFAGVNVSIEKTVPPEYCDLVFEERQLPVYNPFMQHNKFCESSVFFHTYLNAPLLLDPFRFVGFLQYDMVLEDSLFQTIEKMIEEVDEPDKILFTHYVENSERHIAQCIYYDGWNEIIMMYNKIYGTSHILEEVLVSDIPLYHCYVVPREVFRKMMEFATVAVPRIFEMLGADTAHLPYHLERCHGIFLLLHTLDKHILRWIHLPGIEHRDGLKDTWQDAHISTQTALLTTRINGNGDGSDTSEKV